MQRYISYINIVVISFVLLCISAAHTLAAGRIRSEDFSYQGIMLGGSEDVLRAKWGEPDSEITQTIWGIHLKSFTYGDVVISVSISNRKVVDINLIGEKYRLRKDIHYGTTSSYLLKVYGKAPRQLLDGNTCYIFSRSTEPHKRLILNLDPENKSLVSARITMLPLTDEEADAMALSDDDSFAELDLNNGFIGSKEIDVSNLPQNDNPQLGGYHK